MDDVTQAPRVPLDTTKHADDVQLEAYRRLGGAGRVAVVFRLNKLVRDTAMAGIRSRHPEYDDAQVRQALVRLTFGDALTRSAFPRDELVEP